MIAGAKFLWMAPLFTMFPAAQPLQRRDCATTALCVRVFAEASGRGQGRWAAGLLGHCQRVFCGGALARSRGGRYRAVCGGQVAVEMRACPRNAPCTEGYV